MRRAWIIGLPVMLWACDGPSGGPGLEPPDDPGDLGGFVNMMDPGDRGAADGPGESGAPAPVPPEGGGGAGMMTPATPPDGMDGGPDAEVDAAPDAGAADAGDAGVDCDHRRITCKAPEPSCPAYDEVPSVQPGSGCYGPCVKIGQCPCESPQECPHAEKFTCINATKICSPYL